MAFDMAALLAWSACGRGKQDQSRSSGSSCFLVRPGSHDAKNMKDPCCVLLQAIRCYRLPLEEHRLREKKGDKTKFGFEQRERGACVCVFFRPAGLR